MSFFWVRTYAWRRWKPSKLILVCNRFTVSWAMSSSDAAIGAAAAWTRRDLKPGSAWTKMLWSASLRWIPHSLLFCFAALGGRRLSVFSHGGEE